MIYRPGANNLGTDLTGYTQFHQQSLANIFPDLERVGYLMNYLNQNQTKEALHVGHHNHSVNSSTVFQKLSEDFMQSVAHNLTELIGKYKVLLFTGNFDIKIGVTSVNGFLENRGMVSTNSDQNFKLSCLFRVEVL